MKPKNKRNKLLFQKLQWVPMIGPVTAQLLMDVGVTTPERLVVQDPELLYKKIASRWRGRLPSRIKHSIFASIQYLQDEDMRRRNKQPRRP